MATDARPDAHFPAGARRQWRAWSLLLTGLLLGLAAGLAYAWLAAPVVYVATSPAWLGPDERAEYIYLVSRSYAVDSDWPRAARRLAVLEAPDTAQTVTALLEQAIRAQHPPDEVRSLAILARALGVENTAVALFAPEPTSSVPAAPSPMPPPGAVALPLTAVPDPALPTRMPISPTEQPIYRLLEREPICTPDQDAARVEVVVLDARLNPLPGAAIEVTWEGGADRFFTGFKPAQGPGYADFSMAPGVRYSLTLPDGGPLVDGLEITICPSGMAGGWRLTFQNLVFAAAPTPPGD